MVIVWDATGHVRSQVKSLRMCNSLFVKCFLWVEVFAQLSYFFRDPSSIWTHKSSVGSYDNASVSLREHLVLLRIEMMKASIVGSQVNCWKINPICRATMRTPYFFFATKLLYGPMYLREYVRHQNSYICIYFLITVYRCFSFIVYFV